jgi:hypothetical protein
LAKTLHNDVFDAALDVIATGTRLWLCSAAPTSVVEAETTYALNDGTGTATLIAGDGNGDWTVGEGDVSGRKLTLAAQAAIAIDANGTATHYAITTSTVKLLFVDELSASLAVVIGNTVDFPATDIIEMTDPT